MASQGVQSRTIIEYLVILGAIAFFFGGQCFNTSQSEDTVEDEEPQPLSREKMESLVSPDPHLECQHPPFDVHIFSSSPLIIYVPSFLSKEEQDHMIEISEDKWAPSTIFNNGVETSDSSIRKSEKAMIDRDSVVQCVEQRALNFQGWPQDTFIERLWTQRYTTSGHYAHHYDWAYATESARRVSTFMIYVQANCTGGGTNFPLLTRPKDERWCEWIDCDESPENGVTFLPKAGSAVYWENFDAQGKGWVEGLHAGMPVTSGVKVGLNVWSWYQKGHNPALANEQVPEL